LAGYPNTADLLYRLQLAENYYGLARLDGSLRPAGTVWRTFAGSTLPAPSSSGECSSILRAFQVDDDLRAIHPEYFTSGGKLRTTAP
ncbi:hypothetical protein, partial [Patulibacter medicamentivorans]|uniref:hypothetical protein n=1 Tax=Patulibacter medicamentivorans TaxID=1097667 RepID=UPI00058B68E7